MNSNLSEFSLIKRLGEIVEGSLSEGMLGIGDDAAILTGQGTSSSLLFAIDSMLEGVHFSLEHLSARDLGWKSLAVTLSDIAAMGARPLGTLISLHLPAKHHVDIDAVYEGIAECAKRYGVAVLGGDTVRGEEFALVSTVLAAGEHQPLLRSAAQSGDSLWVSGFLGEANLGLRSFSDRQSVVDLGVDLNRCQKALQRPVPALELGMFLSRASLAHAAIDVSDGLLQDASHIAVASGLTLVLDEDTLPHPLSTAPAQFSALSTRQQKVLIAACCSGGDDYQLLFSAPEKSREYLQSHAEQWCLSRIGEFEERGEHQLLVRSAEGKRIKAEEFISAQGFAGMGFLHLGD